MSSSGVSQKEAAAAARLLIEWGKQPKREPTNDQEQRRK